MNADLLLPYHFYVSIYVSFVSTSSQAAIFSDSQLRPVVERNLKCPSSWYVNSTPGGGFGHISQEIRECNLPKACTPKLVVLLVGTNDMANRYPLAAARVALKNCLFAAQRRFPSAEVSCSIIYCQYIYRVIDDSDLDKCRW